MPHLCRDAKSGRHAAGGRHPGTCVGCAGCAQALGNRARWSGPGRSNWLGLGLMPSRSLCLSMTAALTVPGNFDWQGCTAFRGQIQGSGPGSGGLGTIWPGWASAPARPSFAVRASRRGGGQWPRRGASRTVSSGDGRTVQLGHRRVHTAGFYPPRHFDGIRAARLEAQARPHGACGSENRPLGISCAVDSITSALS